MASVSATSSANQYGVQQLMVLQARRNADQAEQTAQALTKEAKAAQQQADQAEKNARDLSIQSEQAQERAGQARRGLAALNSQQQAANGVSLRAGQAAAQQQAAVAASSKAATSTSTPVTNSQGQVTGTIVNTTA